MEHIAQLDKNSLIKQYIQLTKPGIIMGNIVTATAGYMLAAQGALRLSLFITALLGLSFVIASACVCNNYIDRDLDKKMARTQNRALARGLISTSHALIFASILGLIGIITLLFFTNLLTAAVAVFGFIVYVLLYSFSKYLTPLCTLIGSAAGAVPPVVGYTAITARLDLCAILLFFTIVMWQMPHFFAIAIYRLQDYQAAAIPVVPVKRGIANTKIQMLLYIIAFMIFSALLTVYDYTSQAYLFMTSIVGGLWLLLALKGFTSKHDALWARQMFVFSLLVVMALCFTMVLSSL